MTSWSISQRTWPAASTQREMFPALRAAPPPDLEASPGEPSSVPSFEEVYEEHFDFLWRSVRRLGVHPGAVDDVLQEILLTVHRRLPTFEGRSALKTWLFGIVLYTVRDHRKARQRHPLSYGTPPESISTSASPEEQTELAEAVRILYGLLDEQTPESRELLVMADIEEMSVPEIAEILGVNVNTVYSRLRTARASFERAVLRHRAGERWRTR